MHKTTLSKAINFIVKYPKKAAVSYDGSIKVSVFGNNLVEGILVNRELFDKAFETVVETYNDSYVYCSLDSDAVVPKDKTGIIISRDNPTPERIAFDVFNRVRSMLNGVPISVSVTMGDASGYADYEGYRNF